MHPPSVPPTGYARLAPSVARAVLWLALLVAAWFGYAAGRVPSTAWNGRGTPGQGDVALFRAIVDRVQHGEGYYAASAAEMHARGYPTRSLFNWRMPLPLGLAGHMPDPIGAKLLLSLLALAAAGLSFEALARENHNRIGRAAGTVLLLGGPLMFCLVGDLFVMPELWCGVLVVLSLACCGLQRPRTAAALGLAALALRELALPYCLLMLGWACWQRRRGEIAVWLLGLVVWTGYFALHAWNVQQAMPAEGLAHARGWIRFGGLSFVLATTRMNAYLMALPVWATGLYLAAALFGLAGWNTPWGQRVGLTACLYMLAFAVAGQQFNAYWGCVVAPLWCLAVARVPASLADVWRASRTAPNVRQQHAA